MKKTRLQSTQEPGVGHSRYELLRAAASRTAAAMAAGFYLEATTLIESLLAERLEKRAQFFWKTKAVKTKDLERVKDGFANLGPLTTAVLTLEDADDIKRDVEAIQQWSRRRNQVLHEMAKFGEGARGNWDDRYGKTKEVATSGVEILLRFDKHDRRESHLGRNKHQASATCPNALASLGQTYCEWCREGVNR